MIVWVATFILRIITGRWVTKIRESFALRVLIYSIIASIALVAVGFYVRNQIIENYESKVLEDVREKAREAVRAGDAVDTSPSGLRKDDGFRRN